MASYLLGLHSAETLLKSPNFGNLFETLIVTDFLKRFLHFGQMPSVYYLRTRDGLEIDLVLELNQRLHLFEIKTTMTILPHYASSLQRAVVGLKLPVGIAAIISRSPDTFLLKGKIYNYNWKDILSS